MMNRRAFLTTVGVGVVAAPVMVEAQHAAKIWQIGVMVNLPPTSTRPLARRAVSTSPPYSRNSASPSR